MLFGFIIFRDRRARLHRIRHQAVVGEFERHHIGRLAEGVFHRGFITERPVVDHVAGCLGVQLRRARLDRRANVGRGRKLLIIDDHRVGRIARLVLGLGDHHRDRLSDEAHRLRRHRRPRAHLHRRAVLGCNRPAADQIADLVIDDLLSREHADHAGHFHCRRGIDALHPGMSVRTAHEVGMRHALQLDVVDVAAFAGDETPIFLAHHACANTFNTHRISPCRAASTARNSRRAQIAAGS